MSTVTHDSDHDGTYEAATDTELHEHHPSDAQYWKVGAILAVITGLEVSTYFITDDPYSHELAPLLIGSLLIMMVAKFITIGAYFMHLRFDNKLFRNVFVSGLILAVVVFVIVLTVFGFWTDEYEAVQESLRVLR
jgi:cytochrome c oxidase subunit 4